MINEKGEFIRETPAPANDEQEDTGEKEKALEAAYKDMEKEGNKMRDAIEDVVEIGKEFKFTDSEMMGFASLLRNHGDHLFEFMEKVRSIASSKVDNKVAELGASVRFEYEKKLK